ncbi:hypothetical protein KAW18_11565 [candidate division WOR-3 bacterium]|nr:hypothetical protein [candidate division WOR-3 bacterium]
MFFLKNGKEVVQISKELRRLRNQEPQSSDTKNIIRTNIMGYELGAIQQFTTKNSQSNLPEPIKRGLEAEAKLGMADLIIQCRMLCLDMYWNFDEIQKIGLQHLKERHEDFKKEGFAE